MTTLGELDKLAGPAQIRSPHPDDVYALTHLLDVMDGFRGNDQRARYLLSCNWGVQRISQPKRFGTEQSGAAARVTVRPIDPATIQLGDFVLYTSASGTEMLQVLAVGPGTVASKWVSYRTDGDATWELVWRNPPHRRPAVTGRDGFGR